MSVELSIHEIKLIMLYMNCAEATDFLFASKELYKKLSSYVQYANFLNHTMDVDEGSL